MTKRPIPLWLVGCTFLVIAALSAQALADSGSIEDPDDSPGVLDIASIAHSHDEFGFPSHDVVMQEEWDNAVFLEGQEVFLKFWIDRKKGVDVIARIDATPDGDLYAVVAGKRSLSGYARAWRPDGRTVRVEFPPYLLATAEIPFSTGPYRWRAVTRELGTEACPDDPGRVDEDCIDRTDLLLHRSSHPQG